MARKVLSRAEIDELDSIWQSPGFTPTLVAVAAAFGAWSLLLPVVPLSVVDAGGSAALAGGSTGAFMLATVLTQMVTPKLLRSVGYNPVMVAAAFMLGVPALGHMLGDEAWVVLLFSALRGIGFGAISVAESALIAELVPVRFLGKATGMLGVFIGLAQMAMLPLGLIIVDAAGYDAVYVTAAVVALVAAVMCLKIPRIKAASPRATADDAADNSAPRVSTWKLVLVPALALTTLSMSFGAVSSFLPAAVREIDPVSGAVLGGFMLSIVGGASMTFRYLAGIVADKRGEPGSLMILSQAMAMVGMALMAVTVANGWSVWLLVLAGVLFGGGFGMVQNEALLSMFHRLPRSKVSEASAIWNIFYDSGTGIGSVIYGAIVASVYYSGTFAVGAVIIAVGILMTTADLIIGRHRVTEYDNIKTRLKSVRVTPRRKQPNKPRTVLTEQTFDRPEETPGA